MSGCFDAQMIICALTALTSKEPAAQKEFRLRRVVKSHGRVMEASQAMAGKSALQAAARCSKALRRLLLSR